MKSLKTPLEFIQTLRLGSWLSVLPQVISPLGKTCPFRANYALLVSLSQVIFMKVDT